MKKQQEKRGEGRREKEQKQEEDSSRWINSSAAFSPLGHGSPACGYLRRSAPRSANSRTRTDSQGQLAATVFRPAHGNRKLFGLCERHVLNTTNALEVQAFLRWMLSFCLQPRTNHRAASPFLDSQEKNKNCFGTQQLNFTVLQLLFPLTSPD